MSIDKLNLERAGQGGLEAADRNSRAMATWAASPLPTDLLINSDRDVIGDRARDFALNDGYASGAVNIHKDNIVGHQYRLNARPDVQALGIDDSEWVEQFQFITESRFNSMGGSTRNWFDAGGAKDFTTIIRQAIGMFVVYGEVLGVLEWLPMKGRPFATAVQFINPSRLCNPNDGVDTNKIKSGIERDFHGKPIAYHIRKAHRFDNRELNKSNQWVRVEAETEWGRQQVIHVYDQLFSDQTRGVSEMVSVLKQMRMTRRLQDVELQQAVLQATVAATIESELPAPVVAEMMGASVNAPNFDEAAASFLASVGKYKQGSNLQLDHVRVPVLYPNTKLNLQQVSAPTGTGSDYESSLLRHIAAALGISYEQFARDYTKTNYSSARASMAETWKFMQSRKAMVADKVATMIYRAWLEEQIQMGEIPLPKGKGRAWIYKNPFILDALSRCSWIGSARGQIDEMKETQAAILRIRSGLSTLELECARLGLDWREMLGQLAREKKIMEDLGLDLGADAEKPVVNKSDDKSKKDFETNQTEDEL